MAVVRLDGNAPTRATPTALMTIFLLLGVLPTALLTSYPIGRWSPSLVGASLVLLYSTLRLAWMAWAKRVAPLLLVFYIFAYISFGLSPLAQAGTQIEGPVAASATDADFGLTSLCAIIGLLSFDFGYSRADFRERLLPLAVDTPKVNIAALRILVIGSLGASAYFVNRVGVGALFLSRQDASETFSDAVANEGTQAGVALIGAIGTVPVLMCLLVYCVLVHDRCVRITVADRLLVLALVAANALVNNPFSNSRYWELSVVFAFALVVIGKRPRLFGVLGGVGIVGAILVFPLADFSRYAAGNPTSQVGGDPWVIFSSKDYDQYTMFANAISYTFANGFSYGYQLLGSLLFFVPRTLWGGKPFDTGVAIGEWMGVGNVNLSSPLVAEGWVNGGFFGVVALLAIFGYIAGKSDGSFSRGVLGGTPLGTYILVIVVAGYEFILLRGPLIQAMGRLFAMVLFAIVINMYVARRKID